MEDKLLGFLLLSASSTAFVYYTLWVIVTPFVEEEHYLQTWFPDRYYAIAIPAYLGLLLCVFVAGFIGHVMLKARKPKSC
ncbi:hypothetical protein CYMTET_42190 [Cymbomonas tetramitiformis]|uniref:Dolichol phosphate-mannose biosynthesis regulatory protein n=1 Tax=Cymbomonas tetramitiformis TaxID=36881 RepID=A0AAE0C5P9_9CHLO|nr:hypothetical protein CYMTET_42190 [Cymbomonas tetramitiformis]